MIDTKAKKYGGGKYGAIKEAMENPDNIRPDCIVCFRNCHNIIPGNKIYCCLDLPTEYIKSPLRQWLCTRCARRKLREYKQ